MLVTTAFIFLGSFASGLMATCEPFLVLGMMLLLGLPHGATDHGLFVAISKKNRVGKKINFYLAYGAVIAAYGLVWFLFPLLAFGLFMLLSVYHFGQSNWVDVSHRNGWLARGHYLLWGTGILLTPILLYADESISIVTAMTSSEIVAPGASSAYFFIGCMALLNVSAMIALRLFGRVNNRRLFLELLAYALLSAMFFTNSLLLGFTVYFVCWHSLDSAKDQWHFFQRRLSPGMRKQLYREIGMTVLGAFAFCLIVWFGPGPEAALQPGIIGGVFMAISLLTLPHMLLVEQLYISWSPQEKKELSASSEAAPIKKHITKPWPTPSAQAGERLTITH